MTRNRTIYPEDVVGGSESHHSALNDVLKTLQEKTMELKDAVDAAKQLFHVVVWQERLAPQRLQVSVDQIYQILHHRTAVTSRPHAYRLTTSNNEKRCRRRMPTCMRASVQLSTVASWVEKVRRTGSCNNFSKNYDTQLLILNRVLKISIFSRNLGIFHPNLAFLDEKFPTRRRFSHNFPTAQNLEDPCHYATQFRRRQWVRPNNDWAYA